MKKYIPLLIFTLGLSGLQSCREVGTIDLEDHISAVSSKSSTDAKDVKFTITNSELETAANDNDPDPPVKDGQDWRGASTPLSNHASAYFGFAQ